MAHASSIAENVVRELEYNDMIIIEIFTTDGRKNVLPVNKASRERYCRSFKKQF